MALSIGVGVGSKIDVGGHIVQVKDVLKRNVIVISVDGGPDVVVTDEERRQILPDVFVFAGVGPQSGNGNRLAFEADRSIPIHRVKVGTQDTR